MNATFCAWTVVRGNPSRINPFLHAGASMASLTIPTTTSSGTYHGKMKRKETKGNVNTRKGRHEARNKRHNERGRGDALCKPFPTPKSFLFQFQVFRPHCGSAVQNRSIRKGREGTIQSSNRQRSRQETGNERRAALKVYTSIRGQARAKTRHVFFGWPLVSNQVRL